MNRVLGLVLSAALISSCTVKKYQQDDHRYDDRWRRDHPGYEHRNDRHDTRWRDRDHDGRWDDHNRWPDRDHDGDHDDHDHNHRW